MKTKEETRKPSMLESLNSLQLKKECDARIKDLKIQIVAGLLFMTLMLAIVEVAVNASFIMRFSLCSLGYVGLDIAHDAWKLLKLYKKIYPLIDRAVKYQEDFDRKAVGAILNKIGIMEIANGK